MESVTFFFTGRDPRESVSREHRQRNHSSSSSVRVVMDYRSEHGSCGRVPVDCVGRRTAINPLPVFKSLYLTKKKKVGFLQSL